MTICVIGHVTRDRVFVGGSVREQPGGAAYYAALALRRLGRRVSVVTKTAPTDADALLRELREAGIAVTLGRSPATTTFENRYLDATLSRREQTAPAVAAPFHERDLAGARGDVLQLGPLTNADMTLSFLRRAAALGTVALDAQGMVRRVQNGKVALVPWADAQAGLRHVAFLKVDEAEAATLTGEKDPERAAKCLAGWLGQAPREAIVSGADRGATLGKPQRLFHIEALPVRRPADATGCGDTFFAAYLHGRVRGEGCADAGRFAAACATLTLERFGAFAGSEAEARERLQRIRGKS